MDPVLQIRRGDVVLIPFPYVTDFKRAKTRPALIIQNDTGNRFGSTVIVALISSAMPGEKVPDALSNLSPVRGGQSSRLGQSIGRQNGNVSNSSQAGDPQAPWRLAPRSDERGGYSPGLQSGPTACQPGTY